ncbi:response regulator transcription factor [Rhodoferax sp.]|uniref:response regulator n=1 Tax=Rhodoferax sp. TaxID=50421 RepID=UPI002716ECDA|nr:response regulator transcription factor [Rhodoferax sp.]MDO9199140.1 response regulator transcription factor [Rhodoferax sp.]
MNNNNDNTARKQEKTRIMMVDDHPLMREGMARFLNLQEDLDLCCEAGSAEEALAIVADCNPALAIIDISLNGESGLDLIKTLRRRYPELALLAISMHDESVFAERALRVGANGYLMKKEATGNILLAVRQVLAGDIYLSAAMHGRLAQRLLAPQGGTPSPIAGLSEREFEILHLLGLGFGTRQIADKLNRSIKTIEAHRASLKDKLQLKSGAELVRFAIQCLEDR